MREQLREREERDGLETPAARKTQRRRERLSRDEGDRTDQNE